METDLTRERIGYLLKKLTIPASIGMIFNTLYNIIDTFYAGKIGTETMAGMAVAFPIYYLIIALSSGLGSGSSSLAAISLGKKAFDKFHEIIKNSLLLGLIMAILVMVFAPLISTFLLTVSGAMGKTLQEGSLYMNTLFYGALFFIFNAILNGLLTAEGNTKAYRNALVMGFFLNIILDPLFIYGWFMIPQLGTMGIALSTVLIQVLITFYLLVNLFYSPMFEMAIFKRVTYQKQVIFDLLKQGIPAGLNNSTTAFGVFIINYYILRFSDATTMAAYSAATRIEQLALLPALGMNNATLAITGQNYGAKLYQRIFELRKVAIKAGVIIMVIGAIIIYPLAQQLIGIFNDDAQVIMAGVTYLRIEVLAFPTYVILGILLSILQGIKKPGFAVIIGLYRQILMPIPLFYFLGQTLNLGVKGIWWGVVFLTWSSVFATAIYNNYQLSKLK